MVIEENEVGFCSVDGSIDSNNGGYTGSGFANTSNAAGTRIHWRIKVASAGSYRLEWRYASGTGDSRSGTVKVNDSASATVDFPTSGAWDSWTVDGANVNLTGGVNNIILEAKNAVGLPNIDSFSVAGGGVSAVDCSGSGSSTSSSSSSSSSSSNSSSSSSSSSSTSSSGNLPSNRVGLYRTFERALQNTKSYANKFADVELKTTFTSPSGKVTEFYGFFDGDGAGGGNKSSGNVWKMRFIPDELGTWKYKWTWSDGSLGGEDTFLCETANAGKGILRAYKNNPRWFAYNGTEPVWLKSYYESGHGSIAQPLEWLAENVYQPMIDRGYNHFQVNWLLSLCCFTQYYHDGPKQSTSDLTLYEQGKASSTMRLDVWEMMERNVAWLNDRNVGLHMFLGFDGSRNSGPKWTSLSAAEKEFYVKYVVSRLGGYANIAGWSYVWEVPGNREDQELGWARLVKKYDVFDHLRTYQDEMPKSNEYSRSEYNFAAIENHLIYSNNRDDDRPHWKEGWTHHEASLAGYVTGKPTLMIEGNALWRRYWAAKTGATRDDLRQAAWGVATAAGSFLWAGHQGQDELVAFGPEGLPFHGTSNPYSSSAFEIDVLSDVMTKELSFYKMTPGDKFLSNHDAKKVWCLAEPGAQYLVFSAEGKKFDIELAAGTYNNNKWIDTKTGKSTKADNMTSSNNQKHSFQTPNSSTDWVLLIRK